MTIWANVSDEDFVKGMKEAVDSGILGPELATSPTRLREWCEGKNLPSKQVYKDAFYNRLKIVMAQRSGKGVHD